MENTMYPTLFAIFAVAFLMSFVFVLHCLDRYSRLKWPKNGERAACASYESI